MWELIDGLPFICFPHKTGPRQVIDSDLASVRYCVCRTGRRIQTHGEGTRRTASASSPSCVAAELKLVGVKRCCREDNKVRLKV